MRKAAVPAPPPVGFDDIASAPAPTASPPLSSLPGEGYESLPDAPSAPLVADSASFGTASIGASSQSTTAIPGESAGGGFDWSTSFRGLSERPFDKEVADALLKPLAPTDVEIKPGQLPGLC